MARSSRRIRREPRLVILVTTPALLIAACGSAISTSGTGPYPTGSDIAYVSNGSGWVPFNLVRHSVGPAISIPPSWAMTVAPGGVTAYGIGANGIVAVDLKNGTIGPPISKVSHCQSISSGGGSQTLYVAGCGESAAAFTSILPVNVKTGAAGVPIPVPGTPSGVFVSPNGQTAYVITQGGATLTSVDLATRTLGTVITVPEGVNDLAITPNGAMAYATGSTNNVIGKNTFSYVTPIDLTTGVAEKPIALLHAPYGIALSPNGQTAYVTGFTYPPGASGPPVPPDVTSIDLVTGRVIGAFKIPGGASGIMNATS